MCEIIDNSAEKCYNNVTSRRGLFFCAVAWRSSCCRMVFESRLAGVASAEGGTTKACRFFGNGKTYREKIPNSTGGAEHMRVKITLACSECKQRNYDTKKNKKNDPDRLELNKYCRFCRKHTLHRETK